MFMPNTIVVDGGSTVRWTNPSNLPHNVVGIFNQTTAQDAVNSTPGLLLIIQLTTIITILTLMTHNHRHLLQV
jgi:plastocyanin